MPKALLSVSDKTGIAKFAKGLTEAGFEILSTGGTQKELEKAGIPVTGLEDVTEFPECFGGRVKTMHPKIMGGVLFRRDEDSDKKQANELGIEPIDLVVVNLYPFEEAFSTSRSHDSRPHEELIELIDIGGPTLLRSAAKNHKHVTVVCDVADYDRVIHEIETNGNTSQELRAELAAKVFLRTAAYDAVITEALSNGKNKGVMLTNGSELRYGENPHQKGSFYDFYSPTSDKPTSRPETDEPSIVTGHWSLVQEDGKKMSYLNILDADGAWNLVQEFDEPTSACIKHANPSGVATDDDITEAFQKSYDADKLSAFGVIIALNRPCTKEIIQKIIDQKIFTEVIIAPGYEEGAIKLLKEKPKIRAIQMENGKWKMENVFRSSLGGVLVQDQDNKILTKDDLTCVTEKKPSDEQINDLLFAWKVVKHAKSNAIVFAKDLVTVGIGCGQTSRVDSTIIAARRAGEKAKGAVMASDAFFPFPDSVEEAAKNGIVAIVQPGGSIRDEEVITKANELGVVMVTTGVRGFRH